MHGLAELSQAAFEMPVYTGFLELASPHASVAIDRLSVRVLGVVVVLAVKAAGHAKNDVPVLVNQASASPGLFLLMSPSPWHAHGA